MTLQTRPTLRGTFGMASSTHWLASQSAMSVLERGGNAFDAAVSAGFVLHVVEPHLNGPGGEVPAIVATGHDPVPRVLCGQGTAPAAATIDHFTDLGLDMIPGTGPLAATVPGAVDAWMLLLRDHGSWTLRAVLDHAIGYARAGHPLAAGVSEAVSGVVELFTQHWDTSAALWLDHGQPPPAHARFTNPAYADTLQRLVDEGEAAGSDRQAQIEMARRAWREGFVAEEIAAFSGRAYHDSSGQAHPGLLTGDDLAAWSACWEDPVTLPWNGYVVAKTGPWGQGPALLQALNILATFGDPAELDFGTGRDVHLVTEAIKLAFADREAWYGDTGTTPLQTLLCPEYAAERARLITGEAAADLRPGSPDGQRPWLPVLPEETTAAGVAGASAVGEPTVATPTARTAPPHGDTCHLDVTDRWGNMISATPSGGWLHGSPTIPALGFCLGTRLQMFWLTEGVASALAPRRRPRTTLTPTMVLRDGQPVLACGSPGGDQQDQWQLPFLLRHLGAGLSVQEAIDAPTWHTRSFPESFYPRTSLPLSLYAEDRLGEDVLTALTERGHQVSRAGDWSLGRLCAVTRDPATGVLAAGANPRGAQGYAVGR